MFPFKNTYTTKNRTNGINTKEFIVLHHTATRENTLSGVIKTLTTGAVSCHFVIDEKGDAYKIGSPDDILWHLGYSTWGNKIDCNRYALGIEIIGPLSSGGFTREQLITATRLVEHLMAVFNIPKENVLRHADFTHDGSAKKILWDGKSRSRKVDIKSNFFPNSDFVAWRNELTPNKV